MILLLLSLHMLMPLSPTLHHSLSMASPLLFLSLPFLLFFSPAFSHHTPQNYIVYMGGSQGEGETDMKIAESDHLQLLSSVIPSEERERMSVGHVYHHAFRGFSAFLTAKEASLLSGIWPESPSFSDKGVGQIPQRWKGVCMEGPDFKKSDCNRKIIGARHYIHEGGLLGKANSTVTKSSSRDHDSHGTHTASTAAGVEVANASYFGLAQGTARGGLPSARIAVYKACTLDNCAGSTILKAIDDAVNDGVDIISISLGMDLLLQADFLSDPIAIAAFHANQMGVMVVCSAGNGGPDPYTVVNTAPWIFTVAASNIDRDFESTLLLGNNASFKGSGITLSNLTMSGQYPLAFAGDLASVFTPPSEASNCYPGSLDPKKVAGKIVVCLNTYPSVSRRIKMLVLQDAGAIGLLYISNVEKGVPYDSGAFPFTQLVEDDGIQILKYINSTRKPTATILSTVPVQKYKPAPVVADFSSRGPGELTENILKPDIMAPGVAILAANIQESEPGHDPIGNKPSKFAIKSGTSMACPHVTGAAAFIKSLHHDWTPSMIKSALMTTATDADNTGKGMTNSSGGIANPHDTGVGEISPIKALDPGLVFPTTTENYFHFLCNCGYKEKTLRSMSNTMFRCPKASSDKLISDMNYPSISIDRLKNNHQKRVTRHVINVGPSNSTYTANIRAPEGLKVNIFPKKMVFGNGSTAATFNVSFHGKQAKIGYNYGSLTWFDGLHIVRIVFAVNIVE
ncbi:CO(2)-response secreted protease isoform X2 [Beta vulgaris subsp. vulgaris]|uniref:CO(2)-response secreted protease isoform X2 n=1 Tax=Beta vulgaris subsp. vulgaris TaxID=3555 RepID=UPI00203714FC|nr:CO(2)-response secreted protease isoform X2 [Beta vulgaris subsp. vulgaris]